MKGNLIIISSPSGGGKGTLIKEILERVPNLGYSVSLTTRAPRFGEENGRHYYFVSKQEFEYAVEQGELLEYAEVHGNMYGTSRLQTERITDEGRDVVLEIDVQGAKRVMELVPDAVTIFILPPSFETLRARLISRATEGMQDLEVRLQNSHYEVSQFSRFKYIVVNDEIGAAASKLAAVILGERQRTIRQTESVQCILDSFERAKA